MNTSTEALAQVVVDRLAARMRAGDLGDNAREITAIAATLHESHIASATYERPLSAVHVVVPARSTIRGTRAAATPTTARSARVSPRSGGRCTSTPCRVLADPDAAALAALAGILAEIPDGSVVLVDGLVASTVPELLVPSRVACAWWSWSTCPWAEPARGAVLGAAGGGHDQRLDPPVAARHPRPCRPGASRSRSPGSTGRAGVGTPGAGSCCASGRTPRPRGTTCCWRRWSASGPAMALRVRGHPDRGLDVRGRPRACRLRRWGRGPRAFTGPLATSSSTGLRDRRRARARLACGDVRHGRHGGAGARAPGHRGRGRRAARGARSRRRRQPAGAAGATRRPEGFGVALRCWLTDADLRQRLRRRASGVPPCRPGRTRRHGSPGCSPGWRDEPHLVDARAAARRRRDRRVPGPPVRHGTVLDGLRLVDGVAGGCGRHRPADDRVLRLAVAPGRPWPRRRAADAHRRRRVLPVAVPQHGAARGSARGRPPGVQHGRDAGDVGRALRAVVWERSAGQACSSCSPSIVLLLVPSFVQPVMPLVAAALAVAAWSSCCRPGLPRGGPSRPRPRREGRPPRWGDGPAAPGPASCSRPRWRWPVTSRRS